MNPRLKKSLIITGVVLGILAVIYSAFTLFHQIRTRYQLQGYNVAVHQVVESAKGSPYITVQSGDEAIKLQVVK